MSKDVDLLVLGWPNSERDRHMVAPVQAYLINELQLNVEFRNIFLGFWFIWRLKPKAVLIAGFTGADINYQLTKFCYEYGIKTVSIISEGNMVEGNVAEFVWGVNRQEESLFLDAYCLWTDRSRELVIDRFPELESRLKVTGHTGMDRYNLIKFLSKADFLTEQNIETRYSKVIGIGGYPFYYFQKGSIYYDQNKEVFEGYMGKEQMQMHWKDRELLNDIYRDMIVDNPDILFVLRCHPSQTEGCLNEFEGLSKYSNVYVSSPQTHCRYGVSDLINVSDLWVAYESTTLIEAWAMHKTTIVVNPSKYDFVREDNYLGAAVASSHIELQTLLDEFYSTGEINNFNLKSEARQKVVSDTVGNIDGNNCVRAAHVIKDVLLSESTRTRTVNFPFLKMIRQLFFYFIKTSWLFRHKYSSKFVEQPEFKEIGTAYKQAFVNNKNYNMSVKPN